MWSTFTSPLHMADITRLEQGRPIRVLTKPFIYHVGKYPSVDLVKIPAGEAIKIVTEVSQDSEHESEHDPEFTLRGRCIAFAAYWGVRIGGKFGYAKGRINYENRARRASEKVKKRDRKLYFLIISTPEELNRRSLELAIKET